ncbi:MAG: hypothetical protein ACRD96_10130, partial [Bryobacteraceae bacterium]
MLRILGVGIAVAALAAAQQRIGTVNAETPEGALLQQIGTEADDAKKMPLLEKFAAEHAKHEGYGWVLAQIQAMHVKAGQHDKALEIGEKLAAHDPNDLDAVHLNLKSAEARKDPDAVKKWAAATSAVALKVAASAKPQDEDEAETWKQRVD